MGISGLLKLIEEVAGPSAVRTYDTTRFKGMRLAVDASQLVYQTVIAVRSSGQDLTNEEGQLTSHLNGIFYKVLTLLSYGITPIFVFDGKPPQIKNKTLSNRKANRDAAQEKLDLAIEEDDKIKNFKKTFAPTSEDYEECQVMLDLMGIPYIKAPGEADIVCAWLSSRLNADGNKYTKGVISDDSDILVFGAKYILLNLFKNKGKTTKLINLDLALTAMRLTHDQLIDLAVLAGCDYCDKIKGIGIKKAYNLILKYKTLDRAMDELKKTTRYNNFEPNCLRTAQKYFKESVNELDDSKNFLLEEGQLSLCTYQKKELFDFMCVKHGFDIEKISNGVDKLEIYYRTMNVTTPNTKKVHKMIDPDIASYIFSLSSDEFN